MIEQLTNPLYILAFVVMPIVVVALARVAVWLHERSVRNGSIDR